MHRGLFRLSVPMLLTGHVPDGWLIERRSSRIKASASGSKRSIPSRRLGEEVLDELAHITYRCAAPNLAKVYELTKKRAQRVTRASIVRINPESCTSQESW